jgi:tetratricopeptide (TPR) repeat protein
MRMNYILTSIFVLMLSIVSAHAQTTAADCSDPRDPKVISLVKQGLSFEASNNLRAAIDSNKKILEIQPSNECALTTIAGLYGKMQDFEQEVSWARKAIQANAKFANAYLNLGNGQASLGDMKAALASFTKAREIEPKNPLPVYSLGVLAEQQEKFPEAIELYAKSVKIDPKFENGYFNLAAAYANMKRFAEARTALKKLLELNPNAQDAKDMLRQLEKEKP